MKILAIHPWVYDFAAHDFWLQPYGFLVLLTYLKNKGVDVEYVDCLGTTVSEQEFGRGKYPSENIEKPYALKNIPRFYKRYGISVEEFRNKIIGKQADFILLTTSMTYWYPGVIDALRILREFLPSTPAVMGGTYATLCYEHALENIPCDYIFRNDSLKGFFDLLGLDYDFNDFFSTLPDYGFLNVKRNYIVLRTSWGCPFNCSYCSIKKSFPGFLRLNNKQIIGFILKYYKMGLKHFVLYDDAFLYETDSVKSLLGEIVSLNLDIQFHTPNALHLRYLDDELAMLLKKSGFVNPHFGLETMETDLQMEWGGKVSMEDLESGVTFLKKAGYREGDFCAYLLFGFPGQDLESLKNDVKKLNSSGMKVSLSEFSPVPGTEIFKDFQEKLTDPLLHNNSIFGFFTPHDMKKLWQIKNEIREMQKEKFKHKI